MMSDRIIIEDSKRHHIDLKLNSEHACVCGDDYVNNTRELDGSLRIHSAEILGPMDFHISDVRYPPIKSSDFINFNIHRFSKVRTRTLRIMQVEGEPEKLPRVYDEQHYQTCHQIDINIISYVVGLLFTTNLHQYPFWNPLRVDLKICEHVLGHKW